MEKDIVKRTGPVVYWNLQADHTKFAFCEYDQIVPEDERDAISGSEREALEKVFPKRWEISHQESSREDGYRLNSTRMADLTVIISSDPNCSLQLADLRVRLGEGRFNIPTVKLYFVELTIFHEGPLTLEFFRFNDDLRDSINGIACNLQTVDFKSGTEKLLFLHDGTFRRPEKPLPIVFEVLRHQRAVETEFVSTILYSMDFTSFMADPRVEDFIPRIKATIIVTTYPLSISVEVRESRAKEFLSFIHKNYPNIQMIGGLIRHHDYVFTETEDEFLARADEVFIEKQKEVDRCIASGAFRLQIEK